MIDPLDPVWNLEGVIADMEAGQVNEVDVRTCRRVQGQIETIQARLAAAEAENKRLREALDAIGAGSCYCAGTEMQRLGDKCNVCVARAALEERDGEKL